MNKEEFEKLLSQDTYLKERKDNYSTGEIQLYLREVNFACPLCGDDLRNNKQKKNNALYEIAHIYPNRPTQEQYAELLGLKRLGKILNHLKIKLPFAVSVIKHRTFILKKMNIYIS